MLRMAVPAITGTTAVSLIWIECRETCTFTCGVHNSIEAVGERKKRSAATTSIV